MAEPFLGEIRLVGFNYAPQRWALCNGSLLAISANSALFSLLATTYGGDGVTTFGLPDLRGRAAMHFGTTAIGVTGGEPFHTLTVGETPVHSHQLNATAATGSSPLVQVSPWLAGIPLAYGPVPTDPSKIESLDPSAISTVGGGGAHENRQPFTCVSFIIALSGIYPSRN